MKCVGIHFSFWQPELLLPEFDTFHKKDHIPCKSPHGLHPFFLLGFSGKVAMYRIPVLAEATGIPDKVKYLLADRKSTSILLFLQQRHMLRPSWSCRRSAVKEPVHNAVSVEFADA